jgi:hypothetical protein
VVFGKTDGTAINLSAIAPSSGNGTGGFVINGQSASDQSGYSVSAAGDVNGDGLADLIIGAYGSDPASLSDAGRSYVVFGKTDGTAINLSAIAPSSGNGSGGFVINGQAALDYSGYSVSAAGDVNGDGLADLIVGARYGDPASLSDAGRSYVVFGKTDGTAINLSAIAPSSGNGSGGFVINGQAASDYSGISVSAAGDVNGDGLTDLIVGADTSGRLAGRSYVVFGQTDGTAVNLSAIADGSGGFVINGETAGDVSGYSVSAAGDVNGDGLADLIVGAYGANAYAGRSYVVFGKANGTAVDLSAIANGTGGFVINGQSAGDYSGYSVSAAGDVNGDGLADLIVGAYGANGSAGLSYVIFGKTDTGAVNLADVVTGGDAAHAIDYSGTTGHDTHIGTAAAEIILGGVGNDTLDGGGGGDVLNGGVGDDTLIVDGLLVAALGAGSRFDSASGLVARVDGGGGFDTLRLTRGASLNLTIANAAAGAPEIGSRLANIERIDLATDRNANILTLSAADVIDMAGMNLINNSGTGASAGWLSGSYTLQTIERQHQLVIDGGRTDKINLLGQWTNAGTVKRNGVSYHVFQSQTARAQVLVQSVAAPAAPLAPGLMTPEQVGALRESQLRNYSPLELQALKGAGFTSEQLAWSFSTGSAAAAPLWQKLSDNQLQHLDKKAVESLTLEQLRFVRMGDSKSFLTKLLPIQRGQISSDVIGQMKELDFLDLWWKSALELDASSLTTLNVSRLTTEQAFLRLPVSASDWVDKVTLPLWEMALSAAQYTMLKPDVLAGIIDSLNPNQAPLGATAFFIASMTPAQVNRLTGAQIRTVEVFNADKLLQEQPQFQLRGEQLDYCIADGSSLLSNLANVSTLSLGAFQNISPRAVAELSTVKLLAICASSADKFHALPGAGFTVANLNGDPTLVAALNSNQIATLQPDLLSALIGTNPGELSAHGGWLSLLQKVTPYQIAAMSQQSFTALGSGAGYANLSAAQVGALRADQFSVIITTAFEAFAELNFSMVSSAQLSYTYDIEPTHTVFSLLKMHHVISLGADTIRGLSGLQLATLVDNAPLIEWLSTEQLGFLGADQIKSLGNAISFLQSNALKSLSTEAAAGLTLTQLGKGLRNGGGTTVLEALSPEQLAVLPPALLASVTDDTGHASLRALTQEQVAALSEAQINALSTTQLRRLNAAGLTAAQLGYRGSDTWPKTVLEVLDPQQQLKYLSDDTVRALKPAQLHALDGDQIHWLALGLAATVDYRLTAAQVSCLTQAEMQQLDPQAEMQQLDLFRMNASGFRPWMLDYKDSNGQHMFALAGRSNPALDVKYNYWQLSTDFVKAMPSADRAYLLAWSNDVVDHPSLQLTSLQLLGMTAEEVRDYFKNTYLAHRANGTFILSNDQIHALDTRLVGWQALPDYVPDEAGVPQTKGLLDVLSADQIANLDASMFRMAAQAGGDYEFLLRLLGAPQVGALTREHFAGLTDGQVKQLDHAEGLTTEQLFYKTSNNYEVWYCLTQAQRKALSVETIGALSAAQIAELVNTAGRTALEDYNPLGWTAKQFVDFRSTHGSFLGEYVQRVSVPGDTSVAMNVSAEVVSTFSLTEFNSYLFERDAHSTSNWINLQNLDVSALKKEQISYFVGNEYLLYRLRRSQLSVLPKETVASLNADQLGQLRNGTVSVAGRCLDALNAAYFTADQLRFALQSDGQNFGSLLQNLSNDQLKQLDAVQLFQLTDAEIAVLTPQQFQQLPGAGLTLAHLRATLSGGVLAKTQLTAAQMGSLRSEMLLEMTTGEFPDVWSLSSQLTADKLGLFSPDKVEKLVASTLTGDQLSRFRRSIPGSLFDYLSEDQVAALSAVALGNLGAEEFRDLRPAQVARLQLAQLSQLNREQIQNLDASGLTAVQIAWVLSSNIWLLSFLSNQQLGSLNTEAVAALTQNQIAHLSRERIQQLRGDGLTARQLDYPDATGLATVYDDLTRIQRLSLAPATLLGMTDARLTQLVGDDLSALTPAQLGALRAGFVGGLSKDQLLTLSVDQLQALNVHLLDSTKLKLTYPLWSTTTLLQSLSFEQVAMLQPSELSKLGTDDFGKLTAAQVAGLTDLQLASLNETLIRAVTAAEGWLATQLGKATSSGRNVWQALVAGGDANVAWLSKLSENTVAALDQNYFGLLSVAQVQAINAAGLVKSQAKDQLACTIQTGQTVWQALVAGGDSNVTWLSKLSKETVAALDQTYFGTLSAAQVQAINAVGLLNDQFACTIQTGQTVWQALVAGGDSNVAWLSRLSDATVGSLQAADFASLSLTQVRNINAAGLKHEQMHFRNMNGLTTLLSLSDRQYADLPADTVGSIISSGMGWLFEEQIRRLTGAGFSYDQLSYHINHDLQVGTGATVLETLSGYQLSQLQDAVFSQLNDGQLGQLKPDQVLGLTEHQFGLLKAVSIQQLKVNQLSSDQLRYLDSSGVTTVLSDLTVQQWGMLSKSTLQELTLDEIHAMPGQAVNYLSTDQLHALSKWQIQQFSDAALEALETKKLTDPDKYGNTIFSYLSGSQIIQVNSAQLAEIDDLSVFGGLKTGQVASLTTGQLAVLSRQQLQAISAANGWWIDQLNTVTTIDDDVGGKKTVWQVLVENTDARWLKKLSPWTVSHLNINQLQGLSTIQLQALNAAGLQEAQLITSVLQALSTDQLAQLNVRDLGKATLLSQYSGSAIDGRLINLLTPAQLNDLSEATLQSLVASDIDQFTTATIGKLSARTVSLLPIAALTPILLNELSANGVAGLTEAHFQSFDDGRFVFLLHHPSMINGLTYAQLFYLGANKYSLYSPGVSGDAVLGNAVAQLNQSTFSQLTADDFIYLLKEGRVTLINGAFFTRAQLDYFDGDGQWVFSRLTPNQKTALAPPVLAQLSDAQFDDLLQTNAIDWDGYSAQQVAAIRPEHVAKLNSGAINELSAAKVQELDASGFITEQLAWGIRGGSPGTGGTLLAALTSSQLANLSPTALGALSPSDFSSRFDIDALAQLSVAQLEALSNDQIKGLPLEKIIALDVSALSVSQLQLTPTAGGNAKQVWQLIVENPALQRADLGAWQIPSAILEAAKATYVNNTWPAGIISALSAATLNQLQKTNSNLADISNWLSVADVQKINPLVVGDLSLEFVQSLSATHAFNLLEGQLAQMHPWQIAALKSKPFVKMSIQEIQNLPMTAGVLGQGLSAQREQLSWVNVSAEVLQTASPQALIQLHPDKIKDLTIEQLKNIPLTSLMQLSKSQYDRISDPIREALVGQYIDLKKSPSANIGRIKNLLPGLWFTDPSLNPSGPTQQGPLTALREFYTAMTATRTAYGFYHNLNINWASAGGSYVKPLNDPGALVLLDRFKDNYKKTVTSTKTMLQGGRLFGSLMAFGAATDAWTYAGERANNEFERGVYIFQGFSYLFSALQVPWATFMPMAKEGASFTSKVGGFTFLKGWDKTNYKQWANFREFRNNSNIQRLTAEDQLEKSEVRSRVFITELQQYDHMCADVRSINEIEFVNRYGMMPQEFEARENSKFLKTLDNEFEFSKRLRWSDFKKKSKINFNSKAFLIDAGLMFLISDASGIVLGILQAVAASQNAGNLTDEEKNRAILSGSIAAFSSTMMFIGDLLPILSKLTPAEERAAQQFGRQLGYKVGSENYIKSVKLRMVKEELRGFINPAIVNLMTDVQLESTVNFARITDDDALVYSLFDDLAIEEGFISASIKAESAAALDVATDLAEGPAGRVGSVFLEIGWCVQYLFNGVNSIHQSHSRYNKTKSDGDHFAMIGNYVETFAGTLALLGAIAFGGGWAILGAQIFLGILPDVNQWGRSINLGKRQSELRDYGCRVLPNVIFDELIYNTNVQVFPVAGWLVQWFSGTRVSDLMKKSGNFATAVKEGEFIRLKENGAAKNISEALGKYFKSDAKTGDPTSEHVYSSTIQIRLGLQAHSKDFKITGDLDDQVYNYWSSAIISRPEVRTSNFSLDDVVVGFYDSADPGLVNVNTTVSPGEINVLGEGVIVDIDDASAGKFSRARETIDLSQQKANLIVHVKAGNLSIKDGAGTDTYLINFDFRDSVTVDAKSNDVVCITPDPATPPPPNQGILGLSGAGGINDLTINLDQFGSALVSARGGKNTISGTQAHQNYAFVPGAEEDTITMSGGFGAAKVAGGAQVTMAGGNNKVSLVLGLARAEGKTAPRQTTVLNGGAPADSQWLSEDKFASGLNDLSFDASASGITMTILDEQQNSTFSTSDYANTDTCYDSGTFTYFQNIAGSNYNDTITIENTTTLNMLQLGTGNNLINLNNSQGVEIYSRAMGSNVFSLNNQSEALIETKGAAVSFINVLNDSSLLAKLGGLSDVVQLNTASTNMAANIITKQGVHTINIDTSGADIHVSAYNNLTNINHTYRTHQDSGDYVDDDGLVRFDLGASMFGQLIRRTQSGIQVVSSDGSNQVLNYNLQSPSDITSGASSVLDVLAFQDSSNLMQDLRQYRLDNVWMTGRPSLLSDATWTADLESMIQAMAHMDATPGAASATTLFQGETYYQVVNVFNAIPQAV